MTRPNDTSRRARLRLALCAAAAASLLAAAGCTSQPAAPPVDVTQADPVMLGHAAWCGMNPPSGYCITGVRR